MWPQSSSRLSSSLSGRLRGSRGSVLLVRRYASAAPGSRPLRLAIVGSGPAGFYAAARVLQRLPDARIDMYEKLPVPFGLVRYGVAPDHPEVKNCQDRFEEVAEQSNFSFYGNIEVGKDISLSTLRQNYHALLFAYGASQDRALGIPGEHLQGVYSARNFVGWYNGLPECSSLEPDLTAGDTAVVVGNGNVALDVARILLSDVRALKTTDIAEHAVAALQKSRIRRVVVAGRRGPMQAAFTIKELRELLTLRSVALELNHGSLVPDSSYIAALPRLEQRRFRFAQLLSKGSQAPLEDAPKSWQLLPLASPLELKADQAGSRVASMVYEVNRFRNPNDKFERSAGIVGTGELETLECSAVFRSIGYKSEGLSGLAENLNIRFDRAKGVIANDGQGRALQQDGETVAPGCYCAGWVQTGPTGVIATTMENAFAVAETIVRDATTVPLAAPAAPGSEAIAKSSELDKAVSWRQWKAIDNAERERGRARGKERDKFAHVSDMLAVAFAG